MRIRTTLPVSENFLHHFPLLPMNPTWWAEFGVVLGSFQFGMEYYKSRFSVLVRNQCRNLLHLRHHYRFYHFANREESSFFLGLVTATTFLERDKFRAKGDARQKGMRGNPNQSQEPPAEPRDWYMCLEAQELASTQCRTISEDLLVYIYSSQRGHACYHQCQMQVLALHIKKLFVKRKDG